MARGGTSIHKRVIAIAVLMALWGSAIGARLYFLQIVESADYRERAERQQQRVLEISPTRGPIYDRNGNELAVSIEVDSLYAVPSEIADPAGTAQLLSPILDIPAPTLETRLEGDSSFAWLKRKLTAREADRVRSATIRGLYFQKETKRFYPNRELAAHVLGFVNIDDAGGGGLEYRYEDLIGGAPGRAIVMTDARGRSFNRLDQPPTSGASLTTTLDRNIQYIVEKEIARTIQETRAAGMTVIVMDPSSGEILAMASYPGFNPNDYGQSPARHWSNRAISHVYEPGSTFKVVTAAAALEESLTTLDEVIDCQMGSIVIFGHRIRDWKPFGMLSVRQILGNSSDVGIIKLGMRLGDDRFADYIARFGFGQRSGIDLPGEERGLSRPASAWSRVSVGAISMGQEIGVTPLQIVNMVSVVANGGMLHRPFVVSRIEDSAGGAAHPAEVRPTRILSPETARLLQDALESVVTEGTGSAAAMSAYTAAGKTGTAQKIDPATGRYSLTKHVASFAGYAPVRNPVVSAVVVIDEPQGARYHGGDTAAPVFSRIVEQILRYRSIPPDLPGAPPRYTEDEPQPAGPELPAAPAPSGRDAIVAGWEVVETSLPEDLGPAYASRAGHSEGQILVPRFYGKSLRKVAEDSLRLGLRMRSSGSGVAVAQEPPAGSVVTAGTRVHVRFSTRMSETAEPESDLSER